MGSTFQFSRKAELHQRAIRIITEIRQNGHYTRTPQQLGVIKLITVTNICFQIIDFITFLV